MRIATISVEGHVTAGQLRDDTPQLQQLAELVGGSAEFHTDQAGRCCVVIDINGKLTKKDRNVIATEFCHVRGILPATDYIAGPAVILGPVADDNLYTAVTNEVLEQLADLAEAPRKSSTPAAPETTTAAVSAPADRSECVAATPPKRVAKKASRKRAAPKKKPAKASPKKAKAKVVKREAKRPAKKSKK